MRSTEHVIGARHLSYVVCLALLLILADARAQTGGDALVGLWASEMTYGPALRGEMTVTRTGDGWRAKLANAETTFRVGGESVRFAFPGNRGQFRGALVDKGRAIEGFWIQPEGELQGLSTAQRFATPLVLRSAGRGVWRGQVRPLENRFALYLKIFRNEERVLIAAFRNPEQNSRGGATQFRVSTEGDAVIFSAQPDPSQPEIRLKASLASSPERLQIMWPDLGRMLELTRRTPAQAAAFFPRPPDEPKYVYRQPPATEDGWATARAGDVGMDEAALARLVQRLIDADPAVRRPALIHSLLVARRGKLVLEEYFYGFDRDRPHDTRSAGKTFASIMLGAAMRQGARISPETPVYEMLARRGPFAHPDARKSKITLAHLMTHTSGLACDDNDSDSPGNENTMQSQSAQPDWWKYTLDLPMAHEPGTRYAYCSANMNLVGAALTTATRTWLPELFERTIARPLRFGLYHWNLMPNDEGYLGGGAYLRPRDLLKLGQLYLEGGAWQGRRIVDASWVARSTAPHVEISPATTGLAPDQFQQFYGENKDGYAWHLSRLRAGQRVFSEYEANGNGGQLLMVMPELDLVVVFTAGNYGQGGIWGRFRDQVVPNEIIPSIRR